MIMEILAPILEWTGLGIIPLCLLVLIIIIAIKS